MACHHAHENSQKASPGHLTNKWTHYCCFYTDDLLLIGHSYEKCIATIVDTIILLENLGFVISPLKSIIVPVQEITFLGFC